MRIIGLDLSLTSTGVANENGQRTLKAQTTGMKRLVKLRDEALRSAHMPTQRFDQFGCFKGFCHDHVDLVVIEGYSMGTARQSSHAHGLGELGGVVRLALFEAGIPYVDIAPASLKKYATGKGNASKDLVYGEAIRRLGYTGQSNDEADAMWLRAMALDAYGEPIVKMPAANRTALDAIRWPLVAPLTAPTTEGAA